ncbi:MAG: o-succinylbenzoate synthase [Cyclobacteriaceae bacterium]|nr:MAG: o-succinylbenzoate synthase [Cyclobacteriaceae bacterium]
MRIRINKISASICEHPLDDKFVIVSNIGVHRRSRFVLVEIQSSDEITGYGEGATTAIWSGETAETAKSIVENIFAPNLENQYFDHPGEVSSIVNELAVGNPFAKAAVDTAFWDLWARTQCSRVSDLVADRRPIESIPTRASIGVYNIQQTVSIATAFWEAGIRVLKFKVGVPPHDDVARLKAVREELGDDPVFTIDPNGGYSSRDIAVAAIEALLPFNLKFVEQPTPRDRIQMLADVRRRIPVPIIADESIFTKGHLYEALDCDAFDILSVYPGKNGGFTSCLDMVETAKKYGKACVLGSNLETDLGQAAMANLAAGLEAFPVEEIAGDLGSCMYYKDSSVTNPLALSNGRINVPEGIGFGVSPITSEGNLKLKNIC